MCLSSNCLKVHQSNKILVWEQLICFDSFKSSKEFKKHINSKKKIPRLFLLVTILNNKKNTDVTEIIKKSRRDSMKLKSNNKKAYIFKRNKLYVIFKGIDYNARKRGSKGIMR